MTGLEVAYIVQHPVEHVVLDEHEILTVVDEGIHSVAVNVAELAAEVVDAIQHQFFECRHILSLAVLACQNNPMHKGRTCDGVDTLLRHGVGKQSLKTQVAE